MSSGRSASGSARAAVAKEPDEAALLAAKSRYPDGIQVAPLLAELEELGINLSEATFRKWVQQGLLPRSVRVGRPGMHKGSQGFYPASVIPRIAEIRRLMGESLTAGEIGRALRFRDELSSIEQGLAALIAGLGEQLAATEKQRLSAVERRAAERLLEQLKHESDELVRRLGELERRVVTPLEREAKARAFGTGAGGGAEELL